jgi:hypothetical protein
VAGNCRATIYSGISLFALAPTYKQSRETILTFAEIPIYISLKDGLKKAVSEKYIRFGKIVISTFSIKSGLPGRLLHG